MYDYGNLTTPAKTYNYTYLTDTNYTSRYIRNRVVQVTSTLQGRYGATRFINPDAFLLRFEADRVQA